MTTDVAIHNESSMGAFDATDETVARYLGLDPRKPADRAAVAVCRHYGFDPLLKHVVVIPQGGVYITRDGLLNVAHRSGQLDGIVVEKYPTLEGDEWVAVVSVYRKDMRHPFTFPGRYPVNGGNRKHAPEMALKCAEAHALRRAFDIGGLPTEDEQRPDDASRPVAAQASASDFMAATPVRPPADETFTETPEGDVADVEDAVEVDEPKLTARQRGKLFALFTQKGIPEAEQTPGIAHIIGRPIEHRDALTTDEFDAVIAALESRPDAEVQP